MVYVQQLLPLLPIDPLPRFPSNARFHCPVTLRKTTPAIVSQQSSSSLVTALTQDEIPPNALRRKQDPQWRGGFSLGVDLGMSRTGVALSKGFTIRPLTVLELRGQKLELRLLDIAEQEEADEFIIGLPISSDGKETSQSNLVMEYENCFLGPSTNFYLKEADEIIIGLPISSDGKETSQSNIVRSVAGRFAARAAERGWRVYLQNEHGTSAEALNLMISTGLKKSSRQGKIDAYAAMMVLERYFSMSGQGIELVLPKDLGLQEKIRHGPPKDLDFYPDEFADPRCLQ